MSGRWSALEELDAGLKLKVGKMISQLGEAGLKQLSKTRKAFREEIFQSLKAGKIYQPNSGESTVKRESPVERFARQHGLSLRMARFLYDG